MTLLAVASGVTVLSSGILGAAPPRATAVAVGDDAPMVRVAPALVHALPTPTGPPVAASGGCITLPILYYHYIRINPDPRDTLGFQLSVTPTNFQAQMDWLRLAGGHPVTLAQMMAALQGGPALPSHPLVLTFDDGHDDFATKAVPVLLANHFVATTYVVPGFLNTNMYMTDQQVKNVAAAGMVVAAHTVHHVDLTKVSASVAKSEITDSKSLLEAMIGQPVLDFAYPYGSLNASLATMVSEAGFRDAAATTWGTQQCLSNRYQLHRFEVLGSNSLAAFASSAGVAGPPPGWTDPGLPTA
ncbi:MAG: polysaccharide deacetylase family protein [Candidatus Dormibacteria bacterium]